MSGEGKDKDYIPKKRIESTNAKEARGPSRRQTRRVYYREVEVLSSGESEETILSESGFAGSLKVESEEPQQLHITETIATKRGRSKMAKEQEPSKLEQMMEMLLESRLEERKYEKRREEREEKRELDRREAEEREERRQTERRQAEEREERRLAERRVAEDRWREDNLRREDLLIQTLKVAQTAKPPTVKLVDAKIPDMKEGEDVETYVAMFEAALTANGIEEEQWLAHLHAHLNTKTKIRIQAAIQNPDAVYQDIKDALLGCGAMNFSTVAETLLTGDRGKVFTLDHRQCKDKLKRIAERVMTGAKTIREAAQMVAVAIVRQNLVPELKTYVDLKGEFESEPFSRTLDQWETTQPIGTTCFKKMHASTVTQTSQGKTQFGKKPISCFYCGKMGHISRDCHSRLAADKPFAPLHSVKPEVQQQHSDRVLHQPQSGVTNATSRPGKRDITCFTCQQKGHKSPQCPQRNTQVRRIQIPAEKVRSLRDNELFGSVGAHRLAVTCDSGADISVVPEECVYPSQFTGDICQIDSFNKIRSSGKLCDIIITLNGRQFTRRAVTQPGKDLEWIACLSLPFANREEWDFVTRQMQDKFQQAEEETLYLPPEVKDGIVKSGILVSEGTVIASEGSHDLGADNSATSTGEQIQVSESTNSDVVEDSTGDEQVVHVDDGDEQKGECEMILELKEKSSGESEVAGDQEEGSADIGVDGELSVESISSKVPTSLLVEATKSDDTLATARSLADSQSQGYFWKNDLVFRTRLNRMGDNIEQMCLPKEYREKCLTLAHENMGHMGRNKVSDHIRQYFYWPSITADAMNHIKSCEPCQKKDKTSPRRAQMQSREIVTVPSERVAIDLVGPFPVAKGGFRYLLTYLDMATRWPEAIPLKKTTTRIIIDQLTLIFSRCGFPTSLISDNGPQFVAKTFEKWLKEKGVTHVRASPYHPQGNGVVERMHRTLKSVIARCMEKRGNWAAIVPMALYFLRCTPNSATGFSPFVLKHGWEPTTPLQLLYKGWVQGDLGAVDLEEWVLVNSDRIEKLREQAVVTQRDVFQCRKNNWDKGAQSRQFEKGDQVYMRKSGLNTMLADSWEGPYTVEKRNTPLSYRVNTGDRTIPSVHIQMLKGYRTRQEEPKIGRVTSVLQPDTAEDKMEDQYAEAKVTGCASHRDKDRDISSWTEEFADTLRKDPGMTKEVEFKIDTGNHAPIHQRPYNTPQSLIESVNQELKWLLNKGYIRPSSSPWALPMVTVKKSDGTARICVDFKAINAITEDIPFYMPRVEEVLESVGRAGVISKLDLSKGYYQVPMFLADIPKTAFTCHQGKYEFVRMPFGVKNAPAVFQELMTKLFKDLSYCCTPYMDDLVIFSSNWEEHVVHVRAVLSTLRAAGLTANPAKCHWGGTRMEFLGHLVGEGTMSVPQRRVEALASYTRPTTKRGLRSFLGAIGFYRRYIELLASHTAVLTPLTAKLAPSKIVWTKEGELAFSSICHCISECCSLCIPLPQDTFSIVTDASGLGVGGVLQVWRDQKWEAAAFFSRQTRGAEQRYSATELEALALVCTIKHFAYYLYGRIFTAYTDHKPLEQLMSSDRLNPRLRRMSYKLQHWLVTVKYLPGEDNGLADALSREERPRRQAEMTPGHIQNPVASLASGDVGVPTPT